MRLWVKVGLFSSAYLPLFLILSIRNWFDIKFVVAFLVILAYSSVWWILINYAKKGNIQNYTVLKTENRTKESLNYIVPYIIAFLSLNLDKWQDCAALGVLLFILFIIYSL